MRNEVTAIGEIGHNDSQSYSGKPDNFLSTVPGTANASSSTNPKSTLQCERLEHDPEKCEAVFRKDHAQSKTSSAMTIQPNLIAL
jgi:hypothetical protein